jgi:signal transduction histidine kinase
MKILKEFIKKQLNRIKHKTSLGLGGLGILLVTIPLLCLIIVLVAILDARSQEQQLQQNFSEVEARSKTSQLILRYTIDQETSVRGYLLTQESEFLDPYYLAKRDLPIALQTLKRQSPGQETRLNDLEQKIELRLKTSDELLDIAKKINLVPTNWTSSNVKSSLSKSDSENILEKLKEGKLMMDSVRQTIVEFDARQREILNQQKPEIETRRRWVDRIQIISIAVSTIIYLGVITLFRLLDRQLFQRNREELYLTIALAEKAQELADVNAVLKTTNIALNRKKKSLENFIQAAAHDLKTPLRGIASLSQWIQEDSPNLRDSEDYFDLLNERILRMQIIINELLKYTQIESWMAQLQLVNVDLLIEELCHELPVTDNFELQILTPLPKLTTSYLGLKLVFEELIQNSIRHHDHDKGIITLESISYPDRIEFILRDDGPGIPLNYRAQVLGMFQVLDRLASNNVGAGLALVNQAIDLNGGQLWLENVDSEGSFKRGLQVRFSWRYKMGEA